MKLLIKWQYRQNRLQDMRIQNTCKSVEKYARKFLCVRLEWQAGENIPSVRCCRCQREYCLRIIANRLRAIINTNLLWIIIVLEYVLIFCTPIFQDLLPSLLGFGDAVYITEWVMVTTRLQGIISTETAGWPIHNWWLTLVTDAWQGKIFPLTYWVITVVW